VSVWKSIVAVLLVALWSSCAPTKKVYRERTMTVDEVLQRVQERNEQITTLKADGTITVESPEESNTGSFDLMLKKPDSMRVELTGPFGIHVGTLMLAREQFLFYNWRDNTATIGKPDGKTLAYMFRLKMHFDEILNAFTGEFSSTLQRDSLLRFSVENELYVIKQPTANGIKEYRIDGNYFVVTSYRELDIDGKATLTALASDVDDDDDIAMPHLLRVIFPKERSSVTIAYDDVRINEPVVCSFTPPRQAEFIYR